MKFLIVFVALFAVALARPGSPSGEVVLVRQESDVQPESFKFGSETSDGTKHDAEGKLKDAGTDHEAIVVHGSYSWNDSEGHTHTIVYVADENGYQPAGDDVPKAVA